MRAARDAPDGTGPAARRGLLLRDVGESGVIEHLRRKYGGTARPGELAIGDDAAVVRIPGGRGVLSTDLLVEGTHFSSDYFLPEETGWRALSANLSDLAAMGAVPVCYLVALAAPPATPVAKVDAIFRGMAAAAAPSGIRLMGGDTCRGDRLTLCLTVVGAVGRGGPVSRRGARPGDLLYVTGSPGWSRLGLALLRGGRPSKASGWRREAMRAHLRPEARWREGKEAARCGAVAAMIDVSDGILTDLSHLLERDGLGAVLAEESFPVSRSFRTASAALGIDPLAAFLGGGEDYELLMAVRPGRRGGFLRAARAFPSGATAIGAVTKAPGIRVRRADGSWIEGAGLPSGFDHFPSREHPVR
ncbi:MAG: thiamine-phosphate kinase [Deltaproteobacteria bacterium GWB2_65_81]|nr:MAG: thiamine-phosphate kinase [Deltaproteobacteria bacterium GWA2_65_63]OGP26178.1 MAG: thiamine-phosphate kinase [Deltaproteobacteria bacterium GWB2_65_81]OGP40225.1 MAG: thiamine-phosphate kinase [Deltaproteobacteria bacterium GWC2_66_88]